MSRSKLASSTLRIGVTELDQPGSTVRLRREHRVQESEEVAAGFLEIGIDRHRIDFGATDLVVAGVVPDLDVGDFAEGRVLAPVHAVAIEPAQIVLVAGDRPERDVPHDLGAGIGIVRIDDWERLAGHVTNEAAMVRRQPHLARILFGRILIRRRPVDALGRHDLDRHSVEYSQVLSGRDEILNLRCIVRGDHIAGLHSGQSGSDGDSEYEQQHGESFDKPVSKFVCMIHNECFLRQNRPQALWDSALWIKLRQ